MLGVSTTERLPLAPDVPTIAEAGVAGFQSSTDVSMLAPAGTPPAIIQRVSAVLLGALKSPEVREPMLKQGAIIVGGSPDAVPGLLRAGVGRNGARSSARAGSRSAVVESKPCPSARLARQLRPAHPGLG